MSTLFLYRFKYLSQIVILLLCKISLCTQAATIVVTTTVDEYSSDPMQDCLEKSGSCSLREAIRVANHLQGTDIISIPAGTYVLTRPESMNGNDSNFGGDLDINGSAHFVGAGRNATIIDGNNKSRLFHVIKGDASFAKMTLRRGYSDEGAAAILNSKTEDGYNLNNNNLVLFDVTLSDHNGPYVIENLINKNEITKKLTVSNASFWNNNAESIYVQGGRLQVTDSYFFGNSKATISLMKIYEAKIDNTLFILNEGNGINAFAKKYEMPMSIMINNSIFTHNTGHSIYFDIEKAPQVQLSINNTTIEYTLSGDDYLGNGIDLSLSEDSVLTASITGSTIANNQRQGIYANIGTSGDTGPKLDMNIVNSTISSNDYSGLSLYSSGAIDVVDSVVNIIHGTLTNNGLESGIHNTAGIYLLNTDNLMVNLQNTIVANQASGIPDCYNQSAAVISSQGGNLDSDATCSLSASWDLINVDPLLGPLQDNGGPTQTHYLSAFQSLAINTGLPLANPTVDQRGYTRDNRPDIGAYEVKLVFPDPWW